MTLILSIVVWFALALLVLCTDLVPPRLVEPLIWVLVFAAGFSGFFLAARPS